MKTLKEIQKGLQDSLTGKDQGIVDIVVAPKKMTAEDRLQVYHNDYYLRLLESLKGDYECLCHYIGDDSFDALVSDYLNAYPSTSYSIREVGFAFPQFLDEKKVDSAWIALAEFELKMLLCLFSKDAPVLDLKMLEKISPEEWCDLQFTLHPSLQVLRSQYNVVDCWLAYANEDSVSLSLLEDSMSTVIWRYNNEAYFRMLTVEQEAMFNAIANGEIFSDLCEVMLTYFDEEKAVEWVAGTLQTWINEGIFSTIKGRK